MHIKILKKENEKQWDEFVRKHPLGRFSQTAAFKKVIEDTYHYQADYFFLEKDGRIIILLPLLKWQDLFQNKHLVSVPFSDYGGFLSAEITEEDAKIFIEFFENFLSESGLRFLKINSCLDKTLEKHLIRKENDRRAVLKLNQQGILWEENLSKSAKKCIKTAYRENLKCILKTTPDAISAHFYPLYLLSMKRLGTPPHPLNYFLNKLKYLNQEMKLFLVQDKSETIAALLGFAMGETVQITKTVSDPKFWHKRPNDLAHWEFIKWAAQNNYKYFDFGPVRYENQNKYKIKWGAQVSDNYSYYLINKKNAGMPKLGPGTLHLSKYSHKLWSCVPIYLSKTIGPFIRKHIGK